MTKFDRIEKTVNVCGGSACIVNTRIPVWVLIESRQLFSSDVKLLEDFPSLTQSDIDAAIEYYEQHQQEIDKDIRDNGK